MKNWFKTEEGVEFFCAPEDAGVIPEPYPARKLMPDWYKTLSPKSDKDRLQKSTIKRCAPFLDAMTAGWIIPLAADVEFYIRPDGGHQSNSKFYKTMVEMHGNQQVAGNPHLNHSYAWKWINHWFIKIPPNTKALFLPPLNRNDAVFECVSGAVDCEYMGQGDMECINFPFFLKEKDWKGIIKQGTPLVQMILLPRDSLEIKGAVRPATEQDFQDNQLTKRRLAAHESHYRDNLWKPK